MAISYLNSLAALGLVRQADKPEPTRARAADAPPARPPSAPAAPSGPLDRRNGPGVQVRLSAEALAVLSGTAATPSHAPRQPAKTPRASGFEPLPLRQVAPAHDAAGTSVGAAPTAAERLLPPGSRLDIRL